MANWVNQQHIINNTAQVQAAVRNFLPDAEVNQSFGYQWGADRFIQSTWCVFRPGQYSKYLKTLRASQDNVVFANADWAYGWRGFIDSAIEQAIFAAREVT